MNYGGIDTNISSPGEAAFLVIPVPYDLTSTYQPGSRRGPAAILEASAQMELYDDELKMETYLAGIHTTPPLAIDSRGPSEMIIPLKEAVSQALIMHKTPVLVGGEHSISYGAVLAMKERFPGLSVLQLDAHADMRDSYQGSPYSHASVARRIQETCRLVQVGIRSLSAEEAAFLEKNTIRTFFADFVQGEKEWQRAVCENLSDDVYITIDLDVFDPSVMPSTGTPEPGGLGWNDVISLVREVSRFSRIRGFDVVELAPIPGMIAPDFMAAKLIYRFMGYIVTSDIHQRKWTS